MSETSKSPDNIIRLPLPNLPRGGKTAHVRGGRCTRCNEDLNDLMLQALRGEAEPPQFCRRCGSTLFPPLSARALRCGRCKQWLTLQPENPSREAFCTRCGGKLAYRTKLVR